MGDHTNNDPLQDILDELNRIRTRERELIVQLSAILRTGDKPAQPRIRLCVRADPPLPRICLVGPANPHPRRRFRLPPKPVPEEREFVLNSLGNCLQLGD